MVHDDVNSAIDLIPEWMPIDAEMRQKIPLVWTRLLGTPGFNADVIEDLNGKPGDRLLGLGMAIVLNSTWLERLRVSPPENTAIELYRELISGTYSLPTDRELAVANAKGQVSFFVLHYSQKLRDPSDPDTLNMYAIGMSLFHTSHVGYRLSELYQEALDEEGKHLMNMGFKCFTKHENPSCSKLYGLNSKVAFDMFPGNIISHVFLFTPPKMGFSHSERKLLRLATNDFSDDQIADELGLTLHTVKKLWRSIHSRSSECMPDLFQHMTDLPSGTRGPDRRRILLKYLRQHLEELRPFRLMQK